jgi:hypothetical protein
VASFSLTALRAHPAQNFRAHFTSVSEECLQAAGAGFCHRCTQLGNAWAGAFGERTAERRSTPSFRTFWAASLCHFFFGEAQARAKRCFVFGVFDQQYWNSNFLFGRPSRARPRRRLRACWPARARRVLCYPPNTLTKMRIILICPHTS